MTGLTDALGVGVEETLLSRALTHRSFAYENGGLPTNERLEFLGDSVLGLVVTDLIQELHPHLRVGPSTKMRAMIVGNQTLAAVCVSEFCSLCVSKADRLCSLAARCATGCTSTCVCTSRRRSRSRRP